MSKIVRAAWLIVAALVLASCGGGHEDHVATSPAEGRVADVAFLQGMIPHHQQAVTMADAASSRATDPAVKEIAVRIKAAQGPEITQMRSLLKALGAAELSGEHAGHGHAGMLSDDQMQKLTTASGAEFDRLFVAGMIEHHKGAVASAEEVLRSGESPEVKAMAQNIVRTQNAEIAELQAMS